MQHNAHVFAYDQYHALRAMRQAIASGQIDFNEYPDWQLRDREDDRLGFAS